MALGQKRREWGSGTETAQKGHLIPEAGRKEVKFFFQGLGGGKPRKITSNGFTCSCNKLGYQVVGYLRVNSVMAELVGLG